jgi:hypothetical protein
VDIAEFIIARVTDGDELSADKIMKIRLLQLWDSDDDNGVRGSQETGRAIVAARYSDHPDFQPEWIDLL